MKEISKEAVKAFYEKFKNATAGIEKMEELEKVKIEFLGRKSEFNILLKNLKNLSLEAKREIGGYANKIKTDILSEIEKTAVKLKEKNNSGQNWLDATIPGIEQEIGHLNILSQTQKEIENIFVSMGFDVADGPEIETEWYNFDALNMPKDHPARDMQDTFWLNEKDSQGANLVARTHTSNCQVRYMETHQPPLRIIVPGRVFRYEATDATHEHTFYQFEALVVDREINVANFKDIAEKFFSRFFGQKVRVRLRPGYFPFTEPSFEFDLSCTVCGKKGCPACKNSGWLEVGGAGMVNQRVFKAAGYKEGQYQGFAWGFGVERLAMMKHKINDIRLFKNGDLRFVRQF